MAHVRCLTISPNILLKLERSPTNFKNLAQFFNPATGRRLTLQMSGKEFRKGLGSICRRAKKRPNAARYSDPHRRLHLRDGDSRTAPAPRLGAGPVDPGACLVGCGLS